MRPFDHKRKPPEGRRLPKKDAQRFTVFGYDSVPVYNCDASADGTQRRQHVVRRINSEQAKVVVKIFDLFASGFGLARIAKALNEDRIPPPHGGNLGWCPTAFRDILQRDLYRGIVLWNRT